MRMNGRMVAALVSAGMVMSPVMVSAQSTPNPGGTHFQGLDLSITSGLAGLIKTIKLQPDGSCTVKANVTAAQVSGQATASELAAVRDAWNGAHLGPGTTTLPGMIPDGSYVDLKYSYAGNMFHLAANGELKGFYMKATAGEQKLVDALVKIADRVANGGQAATISGGVVVDAGKVYVSVWHGTPTPPKKYEVTNADMAKLLKDKGQTHYVTVVGVVTGLTINVESVNGFMLANATLTNVPGGVTIATVHKNAELDAVLAENAHGDWLKVRLHNGKTGWLPASAVQVGGKYFPLMAPAPAPATGGITGTVNHP